MALTNRANGAPTTPNPIGAIEGLIKAVESFYVERSFQDVATLVHGIGQLRSDAERKQQELQALSARMKEKEQEFTETRSRYLKDFCEEARLQETLISERNNRIGSLEEEVRKLQEQVKQHSEAETKLRKQDADSRDLLRTEKVQHKKTQESKYKLTEELKAKNGQIAELKDSLEEVKRNTQQAKSALAECERRNDELKEDLDEVDEELSELKGFAVELVREDLDTTIARLKDLWSPSVQLVRSYFSQDVSDFVIQENNYAWTTIERFSTLVPVPRSNSRAAKSMRISAILAILATLIDQYIFRSTYLMEDATGVEQLLLDEAGTNSRKESFMRAMLLATRVEEQASHSSKRIQDVTKELTSRVQDLLPVEQRTKFDSELRTVVTDLRDAWNITKSLERKVEPTFSLGVQGLEWEPISLEVPSEKRKRGQDESTTTGGMQDPVLLVLCPGMYAIDEKNIQQVLPALILSASQTEEAQRELQNMPVRPPPARATPNRVDQNRSRRRDSVHEGLYVQPGNQGPLHFLSSAHP